MSSLSLCPSLGQSQNFPIPNQHESVDELLDKLSSTDLEMGELSFEEAHRIALDKLIEVRGELEALILDEAKKNRQKTLKTKVLPLVITCVALLVLGASIFSATSKIEGSRYEIFAGLMGGLCFGSGVIVGVVSLLTLMFNCNNFSYLHELDLIEKQIIILKSDFGIDFLKREENKVLYPLMTNFELMTYLKLEKNCIRDNKEAQALRETFLPLEKK